MRSEDEDEDEEFYDENEEEDEGHGVEADEDEADGDEALEEASDDDGSDEDEGDGEDEDDDEEDEDGEGDEEEDADEEDDEGSEDENPTRDVEMTEAQATRSSRADSPGSANLPPPEHLIRRSLFKSAFPDPLPLITVEAIAGMPLPTPVHSLATSACLSYLLAGGQDGYIRAYDFWGTVNGGQMMTAQQRSSLGLGEGVSKAGLARGWWVNEVEGITGGQIAKRQEPVYSMACESDGLWALAGTQSGPINLSSLRHSPGHLVHTLKGHTSVVSCVTLSPEEKGFISGSWDGTVRDWDLNTGQTVRTYPTHKAQVSSISFRPTGSDVSPSPSPRPQPAGNDQDEGEEGADDEAKGLSYSLNVGPDFFEKRDTATEAKDTDAEDVPDSKPQPDNSANVAGGDVEMASQTSHNDNADSLFGDDDDVEIIAPVPPPVPADPKDKPNGLVLPGSRPIQPQPTPQKLAPTPTSATFKSKPAAAQNIPILSPADWRSYTEDVMLVSAMDGQLVLVDRRVPAGSSSEGVMGGGVGRLVGGEKTPPWCMSASWLSNGTQVLAGRRNGTVEIWDVRKTSSSSPDTPNLLKTLRTPTESGPISCVVPFLDGRHIATASHDNIRLWNTAELFHLDESAKRSKTRAPFRIVAGHHGGTISSMLVDRTSRFLITASGDRGWGGESTKAVLIHEVKW